MLRIQVFRDSCKDMDIQKYKDVLQHLTAFTAFTAKQHAIRWNQMKPIVTSIHSNEHLPGAARVASIDQTWHVQYVNAAMLCLEVEQLSHCTFLRKGQDTNTVHKVVCHRRHVKLPVLWRMFASIPAMVRNQRAGNAQQMVCFVRHVFCAFVRCWVLL